MADQYTAEPIRTAPASSVADTLQNILARRKMEERQAILDQILKRDVDSQIAARASRAGYEDALGRGVDHNITKDWISMIQPGTVANQLNPDLVEKLRGVGAIGPGPTPSTTSQILDSEGNVISSDREEGTSAGEIFMGSPAQRREKELRDRLQGFVSNPASMPTDPLARALALKEVGAVEDIPDSMMVSGKAYTVGPNPGQFSELKGITNPGGNAFVELGELPSVSAGIHASSNRSGGSPNFNLYSDPISGQNFFVNHDDPRQRVPTDLGKPNQMDEVTLGLLKEYANASEAWDKEQDSISIFGPSQSPKQKMDFYANAIISNFQTTPRVKDLARRMLASAEVNPTEFASLSPKERLELANLTRMLKRN